jgi:trigger factor
MVEAEFGGIWQQVQADKTQGGLPPKTPTRPKTS